MISVEVRASVPYSELAAQAWAALERRPVPVDAGLVRGSLRVSDVRIRPLGPQLVVAVTLIADLAWPLPRVHGVLNLSATPLFDPDAQTLRLSDVALTAEVDHALARAAFAYKRREIVDALRGVSFEVEPMVHRLRDRLNTNLAEAALAPGVALQGHVETMRVTDIRLADELVVVASASGRLRVVIAPRAVEGTSFG